MLCGEVSLLDPRPVLRYEVELYTAEYYDRLQVRPAITGLWQVSGRILVEHQEMCELDLRYVRT